MSSGRKKGSIDAPAIFSACWQSRQEPSASLCVAPARGRLPVHCLAGHFKSLCSRGGALWSWYAGSCPAQPQALSLGRLVDDLARSGNLPHVSKLYSGQPGPDRPSSCHWTGAARHCMDGSARLHKQRRTDTRTLRCRCGSHRIFASSTSHSFSPGSFRAFPLAAWVGPLCAWTGCSGDERKHIYQRRAPPGGPCSLWKGTSRSCEGLHQALTLLTSRERTVIILRYGIGDDGLALAFALVAHPQLFQACCGCVSSGSCFWIVFATCSHIICHCC